MKKMIGVLVAVLVGMAPCAYADVQIKSGASTDALTVNSNKAALTSLGGSTRATYIVTATGLATTATYNLSIESSASTGFKLAKWCVGVSNATAAALVTVNVNRRTTASTGGTAVTSEGTASPAISKMDPADASFGGLAKVTATLGTIGPLLDGVGFMVGELAAGTADVPSLPVFCKDYALNGEKMPTVVAGVANGLSITVTAPGAGGLASGSITATIIAE